MLISNDTNRDTFVFRDISYCDGQNMVKIEHYKEGKKEGPKEMLLNLVSKLVNRFML